MNTTEWFKPYYLRLSSMSLAIVLLSVLALASIIGTVLLQNQSQGDYLQQFGPLWYWTFRNLGLFDMYHAGWFLALLAFLMLSLAVCLWRNTPRMLREMRPGKIIIADKSLQRFHHLRRWELKGHQPEKLQEGLKSLLFGWTTASAEDNGRTYIRADRGRLNKWGYICVHAAILIILTGGLISVLFGFRGNMSVVEGGSESVINFLKGTSTASMKMPFEVRCDRFVIDFFPTGQPKEFRSTLSIIDNGKVVIDHQDIIVNEPLYYKGVRIYQASFGDGGSKVRLKLFSMKGDSSNRTIESNIYETYTDPDTGVSLEFTNFSPSNVENMANAGEPKKLQDLGPAVEFILRGPGLKPVKIKSFMNPFVRDGQNNGSFMLVSLSGDSRDYEPVALGIDLTNPEEWSLLQAFGKEIGKRKQSDNAEDPIAAFKAAMKQVFGDDKPDDFQQMAMRALQGIRMLGGLPWPFIPLLEDFDQVYYTGLQLAQDPGMNIVWIGSAILVIGLCIMFYMPHRKLWIVLEESQGKLCVTLGGMTNRNRIGFEQEFHDLLRRVDDYLAPERRQA
jgi:cytochrome c biogenesis protein